MKKSIITCVCILLTLGTKVKAQVSFLGNGFPGGATDFVGWDATRLFPLSISHNGNFPINFVTNGVQRGFISTGGFFGAGATQGDGLRIMDPSGGSGHLDLWTSASQQTHINWNGSGLIQGISSRFEIIGNFNGLWFNTTTPFGSYLFNRNGSEVGRISTNNQWRIGLNTTSLDPARRLEVIDDTNPQLRLSQSPSPSSSLGIWTDMQTTTQGHFHINPRNNSIGENVGINTATPSSKLHVHGDLSEAAFFQLTNTNGTGQSANDGLRMGLPPTNATNLEARIDQQENDRLTWFTNSSGGGGERVRITHIGALNNGIAFNPGSLVANHTRISISHNPATPVTRPLSLLHIGYDVSDTNSNDGWRAWMDVGIFASQKSDHLYLGMKDESTGADAILSWGDNSFPDPAGPDNFRIIFTTPASGLGIPSSTANGVEGLRMTPTIALGIHTGIGGDPSTNPYVGGSTNPTATLEINSWNASSLPGGSSGLRFTDLNATSPTLPNPGNGLLAVNTDGDVIYVESNPSGGGAGNFCADPQNPLTDHYEVPLNNFNYYFVGQSTQPDTNHIGSSVGIGLPCGDPIPLAKLHVLQTVFNPNQNDFSYAGFFENTAIGASSVGVFATTTGSADILVGGRFEAEGSSTLPSQVAVGTWGDASEALDVNAGVVGFASNGDFNFGVYGSADFGAPNYGVFGEVGPNFSPGDFAGFFDGNVHATGMITQCSDAKLKSQIKPLRNRDALSIIHQMNPKSFVFNQPAFPSLRLPSGMQYGLIAQDVESVIPQLVTDIIHPKKFDKTGKVTHPSETYKGVNYLAFIPILISAMKEQQHLIDSLQTVNQERLSLIENHLQLCCGSTQFRTGQVHKEGSENESQQTPTHSITLKDIQTVILEQNNPNPFAERTVIRYVLPKDIQSAEIIFYHIEGKQIGRTVISTRGQGELQVYAQDLSSGIYSYTLIADGKIIDTKKMIKK